MRVALGVEYEGWNYAGFQRQPNAVTVQGELEKALSIIANIKPSGIFSSMYSTPHLISNLLPNNYYNRDFLNVNSFLYVNFCSSRNIFYSISHYLF